MFHKLFGQKKSTDQQMLLAIADGTAVSLSEVPDPVFADKILGDGVAVIPANGQIVSPVDGEIVSVTDTCHAIAIVTNDGVEILIHIGLDTVELGGKGFTPHVQAGDRIKAGAPLMDVDLDLIQREGYNTITPVLILNYSTLQEVTFSTGTVKAGMSVLAAYRK